MIGRVMKKSPDKSGHFGQFGGRYVSETLMPALIELEAAYARIKKDKVYTTVHNPNGHHAMPVFHLRRK